MNATTTADVYKVFILVLICVQSESILWTNRKQWNAKNSSHHKKRQVHVHRHRIEAISVNNSLTPQLPPLPELPENPPEPTRTEKPMIIELDGLYPDVRPCYEGIPRMYEKFAKERLEKRIKACKEIDSNTTSLCHKECILLSLKYITRYTVTILGSNIKQRRYRVSQISECGHNLFGQELLGINTKFWDSDRFKMQKLEKELYFKKVNELGIRNYDPQPFRSEFVAEYGEDIVDERLEAQMRICRIYELSVDDKDCVQLSETDRLKLIQLITCMETALTC